MTKCFICGKEYYNVFCEDCYTELEIKKDQEIAQLKEEIRNLKRINNKVMSIGNIESD